MNNNIVYRIYIWQGKKSLGGEYCPTMYDKQTEGYIDYPYTMRDARNRGRQTVRLSIKQNSYGTPHIPYQWEAFGKDGEFLGGEYRLNMKDKWHNLVIDDAHEIGMEEDDE